MITDGSAAHFCGRTHDWNRGGGVSPSDRPSPRSRTPSQRNDQAASLLTRARNELLKPASSTDTPAALALAALPRSSATSSGVKVEEGAEKTPQGDGTPRSGRFLQLSPRSIEGQDEHASKQNSSPNGKMNKPAKRRVQFTLSSPPPSGDAQRGSRHPLPTTEDFERLLHIEERARTQFRTQSLQGQARQMRCSSKLFLVLALLVLGLGCAGLTKRGSESLFFGSRPFAITTFALGIIATLFICRKSCYVIEADLTNWDPLHLRQQN